jgi:hypothetical protein
MLGDALGPPRLAAITIMGSGRLGPTITALLALAAAVLAARAFARARRPADSTSPDRGEHRPTGLLLGVPVVICGLVFLAAADGGPGTGNGVVASAAAIVLGSVAIGLDRITARQQSRRSTSTSADALTGPQHQAGRRRDPASPG